MAQKVIELGNRSGQDCDSAFAEHPARIVTDTVSFCDCLVTRPVSPTAPQAMHSLDKLITANADSSAPNDDFVAAANYETKLQSLRNLRDSIGAQRRNRRCLHD